MIKKIPEPHETQEKKEKKIMLCSVVVNINRKSYEKYLKILYSQNLLIFYYPFFLSILDHIQGMKKL